MRVTRYGNSCYNSRMDFMKEPNQVSITQIATLYVACLIAGGFSILNAFLHANSPLYVLGSIVFALAAIAGIVFCTRQIGRTLKV